MDSKPSDDKSEISKLDECISAKKDELIKTQRSEIDWLNYGVGGTSTVGIVGHYGREFIARTKNPKYAKHPTLGKAALAAEIAGWVTGTVATAMVLKRHLEGNAIEKELGKLTHQKDKRWTEKVSESKDQSASQERE